MSKIGPELPKAVWAQDNRLRTQHLRDNDWEPWSTYQCSDCYQSAESSWNTPTSPLRWPTAAAKTQTCQATVVQSTCSVAGRSMEPGSVLWWVQVHPREIRWMCSRLPSFRWTLQWRLCQTDWQIPWRIGHGVGWHKQQQENKLGHY